MTGYSKKVLVPIRTELWTVGCPPKPLAESTLASEKLLEEMIVSMPSLLSTEWFLIGQQEDTGHGGRIDLLAIAPDGSLVLIEIKRDRTPREVVAQALDYASWVSTLTSKEIVAIYRRFKQDGDLRADFRERFKIELDEDSLNTSHQIVIVAGSLDPSTERIVNYLTEREIPINVLCFQVFAYNGQQVISRAWLHDPVETQAASVTTTNGPKEPWNGEFYHSFGDGQTRSWEEARSLGFICGGGAPWYSGTLKQLKPGDRIWVNVPGHGYVGVGVVTGGCAPAREFYYDGRPILEVVKLGTYHREYADDLEHSEYFVPVQWCQTTSLAGAFWEVGMFGNQNTICRPKTPAWRLTVDRLKLKFEHYDNCS